jgi:hypothetical protein
VLGQETGTISYPSNPVLGLPTNAYGVGVLRKTGTISYPSNPVRSQPTNAYSVGVLQETGTSTVQLKDFLIRN